MVPFQNANVCKEGYFIYLLQIHFFIDAQCVSLPDNKAEGLTVLRVDESSVLLPFRENVTLNCGSTGRNLRKTYTSGFRQCVYNPTPVRL